MTTPEQPHPDTEWPRWEVFKQDAPDRPHQAVGSVHAADPEHALLVARHVFARRPRAVSLWVAPADAITSVTAEALEQHPERYAPPATPTHAPEPYLVFRKTSHRRSMTFVDHVGEVTATSPEDALAQARARWPEPPALTWWLVPTREITRTQPDDVPSWFEPAEEKTYKHQSAYGTIRAHRPEATKERAKQPEQAKEKEETP